MGLCDLEHLVELSVVVPEEERKRKSEVDGRRAEGGELRRAVASFSPHVMSSNSLWLQRVGSVKSAPQSEKKGYLSDGRIARKR